MSQQMLIFKACTLHNYLNKFCSEKQNCQITAGGLGSASSWICEILTGFPDTSVVFSISTCFNVLQGRGWALPEQEGDLCQAAGGQLLCMTIPPEPALQSQGAQNHGRLGTWWDAVLEYPEQEGMQVTASQSPAPHWRGMQHVLWHAGGDLWEQASMVLEVATSFSSQEQFDAQHWLRLLFQYSLCTYPCQ